MAQDGGAAKAASEEPGEQLLSVDSGPVLDLGKA
jgi:hypothetical protein